MAADRAQHVAELVGPALARGDDVVSDRFTGSTLAYQGYARGLDVGELARLSAWATGGLEPDVVLLLDVPAAVAGARMGGTLDRMEAAGDDFHRRVNEGYRALAAADPGRWVVIDGSGTVADVARRVSDALAAVAAP
jgi:dTMP kinase